MVAGPSASAVSEDARLWEKAFQEVMGKLRALEENVRHLAAEAAANRQACEDNRRDELAATAAPVTLPVCIDGAAASDGGGRDQHAAGVHNGGVCSAGLATVQHGTFGGGAPRRPDHRAETERRRRQRSCTAREAARTDEVTKASTELKHGRQAMLACMGYITPQHFKLPGFLDPTAGLKFEEGFSAYAAAMRLCNWLLTLGGLVGAAGRGQLCAAAARWSRWRTSCGGVTAAAKQEIFWLRGVEPEGGASSEDGAEFTDAVYGGGRLGKSCSHGSGEQALTALPPPPRQVEWFSAFPTSVSMLPMPRGLGFCAARGSCASRSSKGIALALLALCCGMAGPFVPFSDAVGVENAVMEFGSGEVTNGGLRAAPKHWVELEELERARCKALDQRDIVAAVRALGLEQAAAREFMLFFDEFHASAGEERQRREEAMGSCHDEARNALDVGCITRHGAEFRNRQSAAAKRQGGRRRRAKKE